jgi:hypothetical protein
MTQVPYTFGNEQSPIPLSQLDANFAVNPQYANTAGNVINAAQANITSVGTLTSLSVSGTITGGNITTPGSFSAAGNIATGNITAAGFINSGGTISAFGNISGANLALSGRITVGGAATVAGALSASGNITTGGNLTASNSVSIGGNLSAGGNFTANGTASVGGNITTGGQISATGNVVTQSQVIATGNIVTSQFFVGNFQGNIVGNITGAPGSTTQVLFNTAGNVDAVGGLTYNKGSNVLTVLGVISATGNVSVGGNLSAGGDFATGGNIQTNNNLTANGSASLQGGLFVGGTTQLIGEVTGPTAPVGTANNQLATTVFVSNQIEQNASEVDITGGTITVTSVTANAAITANNLNTANWTIKEYSGNLYFQYNGSNRAKLDTAGNFTVTGNVTGFGTL